MPLRFSLITALLLPILTIFTVRQAHAQYVQKNEVFTAGQPITITAPDADTLLITYRPGSNISQTEYISLTDESYTWVPQTAGIISLSTPGGPAQTISVRFENLPLSGLVVLIIAGSILFGGAIIASIRLFGKTSSEMFIDRPDT